MDISFKMRCFSVKKPELPHKRVQRLRLIQAENM